MRKFENIDTWKDLEDGKKVYEKDKPFPRPANKKISDERIKELMGKDNKAGKALIREIMEEEGE